MTFARGAALFVAAMLLQWLWNSHLAFWGIAPQVLLALTIMVASRRGPLIGMLVGFVWGVYADTLRADLFGADALLYTWAGYMAGLVRRQLDLRAAGPLAGVVLILSWAYSLALGLLGAIFQKSFLWTGWLPFLAAPFLNAAIALAAALEWDMRSLS